MLNETYRTENKPGHGMKQGTGTLDRDSVKTGEVPGNKVHYGPVLTNLFVSLLFMALLAVCFQL